MTTVTLALTVSLSVLLCLLAGGICTMSCLLAKRVAHDRKIMEKDVYVRILKDETTVSGNKPAKRRGKGKYKNKHKNAEERKSV